MRVLFMGTPDFAAASLRALLESEHEVVGAVTQPDKPKGRGQKMVACDVKVLAEANGIKVYQPDTLKGGELEPVLAELQPDIIVVAAYGKILPGYVINYPKYGCVNVHGSILPKYRGAAPIQWSVIDGEAETGVTTMLMDKGLDTGDILLVERTPIGEYETSAELFDRLAEIGGKLLLDTISGLERGDITPKKQGDDFTYARMIKKEDGVIDWSKSRRKIIAHICGMNSWPMATTTYNGETFKVISAIVGDDKTSTPGEIAGVEKGKGLKVFCGDGSVIITELQFAGKKRMRAEDYLRGHSLDAGVILGK